MARIQTAGLCDGDLIYYGLQRLSSRIARLPRQSEGCQPDQGKSMSARRFR
jgi:hypothetical protein